MDVLAQDQLYCGLFLN